MWRPLVLLLLCLPGSLPLTGPGSVNGTVGGTVHVQCRYDTGYQGYNKYWCRGENDIRCVSIVETKGGEEVVRNGSVAIRDHASDLSMTVTIENLREDDAGTYWCKIQTIWIWDELSRDPAEQVQVYVFPAATTSSITTLPPTTPTETMTPKMTTLPPTTPTETTTPRVTTLPPTTPTETMTPRMTTILPTTPTAAMKPRIFTFSRMTPTSLPVMTRQNLSTKETSALYPRPGDGERVRSQQDPGSQLSGLHFLLPVFLKLLLLLSVFCAVLWVKRPWRAAGVRESPLVQEPHSAPPSGCPVPGCSPSG